MNPMWAIVFDTWRQSRQQVVFIIMIVLLGGLAALTIGLTSSTTDDQGVAHVKMAFAKDPALGLERSWVVANAQIRLQRGDQELDLTNKDKVKEIAKLLEEQAKVDAEATPAIRRGVEMVVFTFSGMAFTLSMLLFIGACSGYFPHMLESGGIDMVLSKPLDRLRVFLGKYLGGLGLYSAAIAGTYLIVFVGLGLRTGVWHPGIFFPMPLQIFAAGVLFAILATFGVFFRNSTLCLVVGLTLYLLVDSVVGGIISLNRANIFSAWPTIESVADTIETVLPNFGLLKTNATASVLSFPSMEAKPLLVAAAWLLGSLGIGYWKFSRTDY